MGELHRISLVLVLAGVLLCFFCGSPGPALGQESGKISGSWVANGTATNMLLGEDRTASLVQLAGHVNLQQPIVGSSDYWGKCIGLADSETGGDVRCTWRSLEGHEIYLVLETEPLDRGSRVSGTIIGGSDKAEGISGNIEFIWSSMIFQKMDNITSIGGYAREMSGSYTIQPGSQE